LKDGQMNEALDQLRSAITADPDNAWAADQGWEPLYVAHPDAKIVIVGQAPGRRAQLSGIPWDDASGVTLRRWLGMDDDTFYSPEKVALLPMDFYYPGKAAHGDLPPRAGFATKWHQLALQQMPHVSLTLLIGQHAQRHYLGNTGKRTMTETVQAYQEYLPEQFPLVHPSPLNFRWQARNPWFADKVLPDLRVRVDQALMG
jgi:uracil-DNA glycosylase